MITLTPTDQQRLLAYALDCARGDIESFCALVDADQTGNVKTMWHDLNSTVDGEDAHFIDDALWLLTAANRLQRHPRHPYLVRVRNT